VSNPAPLQLRTLWTAACRSVARVSDDMSAGRNANLRRAHVTSLLKIMLKDSICFKCAAQVWVFGMEL
jgi:hypothetical protein